MSGRKRKKKLTCGIDGDVDVGTESADVLRVRTDAYALVCGIGVWVCCVRMCWLADAVACRCG